MAKYPKYRPSKKISGFCLGKISTVTSLAAAVRFFLTILGLATQKNTQLHTKCACKHSLCNILRVHESLQLLSLLVSAKKLITGATHVINWQLKYLNVKLFSSVTLTAGLRWNSFFLAMCVKPFLDGAAKYGIALYANMNPFASEFTGLIIIAIYIFVNMAALNVKSKT